MNRSPLRWGLLSTANINRRLIPAIRAADRGVLGSYEALLADPGVDAVYVSLPNRLHAEWTIRAAQAGKHVLCEKPLALSVQECDQIIIAARSAGVVVVEAVMYLHHPLLQRARQLVQDGSLGDVTLVRGAFAFPLDRQVDVRWEPALGGGSLWDVGSYPVSFIRWIAGEPQEVCGWQSLAPGGVDATFAGVLRYESGVLGVFDCGFRQQLRIQAEVGGTRGNLRLELPYLMTPDSRLVVQRGQEEEIIAQPAADPYRCEVEALTAAVLDGKALPVSLERSRANVATLVALYESARRGEPVRLTP